MGKYGKISFWSANVGNFWREHLGMILLEYEMRNNPVE
jgi:hypothetical protein